MARLPVAFAVLCAGGFGCTSHQVDVTTGTGGWGSDGGALDGGGVPLDGQFIRDVGRLPVDGAVVCGADGGPPVLPPPSGQMLASASTPAFAGVVSAAEPPPPISGGTLAVLRDGITVVVADPDRDGVYIVNLTSADSAGGVLRASIALGPHDQPGRIVEDGAGLVHVVLRGAGELATIDPASATVTMRRAVCSAPRGLAYDAASDHLIVACAGGELVTFSPSGATPVRSLKLQPDLRDVVVDGPRLMVTRFRSAETLVLDADGAVIERIQPAAFTHAAVQAGATFDPEVAWRTVAMPGGGAMMVHQRGKSGPVHQTSDGYSGRTPCDAIVHTSVTRIRSGQRCSAGPAMAGFVLPVDVAVSPDGLQVAMIAGGNGHASFVARKLFVSTVDGVTQEWPGGCGMDDLHGPAESPVCAPLLAMGCPPGFTLCGSRCIDPGTTRCPVMGGTGGASGVGVAAAIDAGLSGSLPAMTGTGGAGGAQDGGAAGGGIGSDGGSNATAPFVPCYPDIPGSVEPVSVGFAGSERVLVQSREPAELWIVSKGSATSLSLSQESRADTGHMVFHSNSGGGLACASCHPEGHEDGRVWDFECEGRRRTQDLSGGLSGTEPFHWKGDLTDFPSLMSAVFVGRMSGPPLDRDQLMATLGWINAVPSRSPLRAQTDAQAVRGKALFQDPTVGCATCHGGPAMTNNATVDVGTVGAFQVPSLRGVSSRAPYMHDGCAPTLAARFGNAFCDGGDAHGKTSQLTPAQIGDLVAYLESL